ncbi:MAG: hypothetical protein ACI4RU_00135 [Acutalibacteraceae bacterium]
MDNKETETFNYIYSAKQQEEIKAIREKYVAGGEKEDKLAQLRRLDEGVTQRATAVSLITGVIGALIMGFGMSLVMTDLSNIFGAHRNIALFVGISVGVVGLILVCMAYPIYNRVLKKQREKIAPEIIRLTDDLIK